MSVDDKKNKEGREFNATYQEAAKKAKALPELIYGNLYDSKSRVDAEGITITMDEPDQEYGDPALEVSYYGNEDGEVVVDNDVNGQRSDKEYFPLQLKLEDIVDIIKNNVDKMSLMVDRGVDPKTTSPKKLKQYLFGDPVGATQIHEGQSITEKEYVDMLIQKYTELWNEAEEKKKEASEALKATAENQATVDKAAAEAILNKIEKIPAEIEYLDVNDLFSVENLKDNFVSVRKQLEEIRGLIQKYDLIKKKQKTDPDQGQYVDEHREKIEDAFKNFKINNKVVDIAKLSKETDPKGIFNDIVFEVNDYKQLHMIGSHEMDLEGI